jgi:hypothetical protein
MLMRTGVVVAFLVGVAPLALAQQAPQIKVQIDPAMGQPFVDQAGISVPALQTQLENEISNFFQVHRLADYVRNFGDAQAFTSRGLGVDYGSNMRFGEIGIAAVAAINGTRVAADDSSEVPPVARVGSNFTVMAGASLGALGLPVNVFGNFFSAKVSYGEYDARIRNVGVHFQIKLLSDRDSSLLSALLRWGGIDITTGFDRSHSTLSLARGLGRDFPLEGVQPAAFVNVNSQGTLSLDTSVFSIPLEISTNVRFLYFLSAYVGAGLDVQIDGTSTLSADVGGLMTGKIPSLGFAQPIGNFRVTAQQGSSLTSGQVRGLVGLQLNLTVVKVFVQLNASPSPAIASVAGGLRIAY